MPEKFCVPQCSDNLVTQPNMRMFIFPKNQAKCQRENVLYQQSRQKLVEKDF